MKAAKPRLTKNQRAELRKLVAVVEFGRKQILDTDINVARTPHRERLMYGFMVAIHNYCESTIVLLENRMTSACYPLQRALLEAAINVQFISVTPKTELQAERIVLSDEKLYLKILMDIQKFRAAHPTEYVGQYHITAEEIARLADESKEKIKQFKAKYPGAKETPDLLEKCKMIDRHNRATDNHFIPLEWIYHKDYRFYCNSAHLSVRGLGNFVVRDSDGQYKVFISRNTNDFDQVVITTMARYLPVLAVFIDQIKHEDYKVLNPYFASMMKESFENVADPKNSKTRDQKEALLSIYKDKI